MTLNLTMPDQPDMKPRITVFGVGGAGGNAVNNMIQKELDGCEFVVANTDAQALMQAQSTHRVQMGAKVTEGLGAGARPAVGASAAEESIEEIVDHLAGAHMCFITAGMGGGTGTGAAPIIAQAARELGVLTVGVVTKPFQFEGAKRMRQAEEGVESLQKVVDTLIIIPNQNLFRLANEKTTFTEAFAMADDVLYQGVKGVTDLMVRPGLINLDFADVRAVMNEMGKAMMGTGEGDGDNRAIQAAEKAIANPLLDEISLRGAKGVLINITGGYDLTLFELDEAANRIREEVDPEANIIVGSTLDPEMEGQMRVSVVATGIDAVEQTQNVPAPVRRQAPAPAQPQAQQPPAWAAAAPAPAPEPEPEPEEMSLFTDLGAEDDEVPPPAYQPAAERRDLPEEAHPVEADADDDTGEHFVAPRPVAAGTPSPEALARLRAAVGQNSGAGSRAHGGNPGRSQSPAGNAGSHAPQGGEPGRARFGINSLLNRMSGHGEDAEAPATRRQPPISQSRRTDRSDPDAVDPEQERIEIPAFLRRQAN